MKIRIGFVSNSSSSSFVLDKRDLTRKQIDQIIEFNENCEGEFWNISQDERYVKGFTTMDNEYLSEFMTENGMDSSIITWKGD